VERERKSLFNFLVKFKDFKSAKRYLFVILSTECQLCCVKFLNQSMLKNIKHLIELSSKYNIPTEDFIKVDCFVKTRKFDLIDIIAEELKLVERPYFGSQNIFELA